MSRIKKTLNILYGKYLTICHRTIKLGRNTVIDHRCEIEQKNNISIGKKSILYKNITIYKQKDGQLNIGNFTHIAPYGYFLMEKQNLTIGDNVAIGPHCSLFCSTNSIPGDRNILFKDSYVKGDVKIGNNVLIGTHCVILPSTVIEDNVVVLVKPWHMLQQEIWVVGTDTVSFIYLKTNNKSKRAEPEA